MSWPSEWVKLVSGWTSPHLIDRKIHVVRQENGLLKELNKTTLLPILGEVTSFND